MANVSLNSQILFTPLARHAKPTSRNFWLRNGTLSAASSGGLKTPQHDPRPSATGASQDDAVLISSDDETTYSDFDDGQSDTSFPPFKEIPLPSRRNDLKSSTIACDTSFTATSGASGDRDAVQPSVTEGADPDDEIALSRQQQTCGLERSPAPPSTLAQLRPWSASPEFFQAEHDQLGQLISAGNPPCEVGQAYPEDTTCGKTAGSPGLNARHSRSLHLSRPLSPSSRPLQTGQDPPERAGNAPCEAGQINHSDDAKRDVLVQEVLGASTLGHVVEQSPSSRRENSPCLEGEAEQSPGPQLEESPPRENTPCLDAASESDDLGGQHLQQSRTHLRGASDDGVGPPKAIPESKRTQKTVRRTRFCHRPRDAHSDADELAERPDGDGHSLNDMDDEDYRPPSLEGSEGDYVGPPPNKRRKTVSAIRTTPKTATTRRPRSSGPVSQPWKIQTPAHGGKRSSRRSIPSPPSACASHDGEGAVRAVFARFEEWQLQNVSLKRVTENGMTTFQLQFSWDSCEHATGSPRFKSPVKRRNSTKRSRTTKAAFTPDEDDLLIKLKEEDKLRWQEIHKQFPEAFPHRERSVGTLQVRYCTKLKQKGCGEIEGDGNKPSKAHSSRRQSSRATAASR
ncbi:hypothetical protein QBC46DRAFT_59056 [Diplogelasinospora grovesii]|uniref:Myb-like domain-containing protein n=1 Tax=Diplogelasinospora grovesii TaxID=303347 RepID=A0AAN6N039_9PEZI|nr:hypothetical protein QBC46DRAFT_59056 [Diplogelasinospora grovesii]